MEIGAEKSKVMITNASTSNENTGQINVTVNGEQLEQVKSFKYLGATITADGSSDKEVKNRIAIATNSLAKLQKTWSSRGITTKNKIKLLRAIVQAVMLYACESWTLNVKITKRINAFEMKCYRRILHIDWKERKTNEYVIDRIKRELEKRRDTD